MSEETSIGWQEGRKLHFNGTITYRCAVPGAINPDAPAQPASKGPYTAKIVDFADRVIGVRADGWMGDAPLYYVSPSDIISLAENE